MLVGPREAFQIAVDRFDRGAQCRRNLFGFLVILENTRQQEADDEDGATNAACYQPVEIEELESEIVNDGLGAAE